MRGKIYVREEADRILPLVRRIVVNARARQRMIQRKLSELIAALGHPEREAELNAVIARLRKDVDRFSAELEDLGAFLRDPETGVVEVYADLDGRIVYLTWLPPARRFEWFHALETTWLARVPLPDMQQKGVRSATEGR